MTADDERETLTKVLLGVHPDTVLHDWAPRVIDARQNAERVIAAGFRRQGPITAEGPARIVQMPPSPETSARYWESHCPVCTTHEGMYRDVDDERLIALRDEHNARHRETPLPGPITDEAVEAAMQSWEASFVGLRQAAMPSPETQAYNLVRMRAALEAAERVRSAVPSTTEQEKP